MNEILETLEEQIRHSLPAGSDKIELNKFDYQSKILDFKYKLSRKRKKGSIQIIIKSDI